MEETDMEEIDIIELLRRVKDGKPPKKIEIDGTKYEFKENCSDIVCIYQTEYCYNWLDNEDITLNTKIKILDKSIIEKLEYKTISDRLISQTISPSKKEITNKINEIIDYVNYSIANYNTDIVDRGDRYAYFYSVLLEKVLKIYNKHPNEINKWWIEEEKEGDNNGRIIKNIKH